MNYCDNGGSSGDGEADGGRGEKESEDGTTSYGGDDGGENGGSEGGSSSSGDREDGASGAAGPKASREAASPDDDDGARSDAARHPSHPAGGMAQAPVEELPTVPLEPSAEAASVMQPDSTTCGSATVFLTEARRRPTTARAPRASPYRRGTRPRETWRRHGVVATTLKLQTCTPPPSTCPCRASHRRLPPIKWGCPDPWPGAAKEGASVSE